MSISSFNNVNFTWSCIWIACAHVMQSTQAALTCYYFIDIISLLWRDLYSFQSNNACCKCVTHYKTIYPAEGDIALSIISLCCLGQVRLVINVNPQKCRWRCFWINCVKCSVSLCCDEYNLTRATERDKSRPCHCTLFIVVSSEIRSEIETIFRWISAHLQIGAVGIS